MAEKEMRVGNKIYITTVPKMETRTFSRECRSNEKRYFSHLETRDASRGV